MFDKSDLLLAKRTEMSDQEITSGDHGTQSQSEQLSKISTPDAIAEREPDETLLEDGLMLRTPLLSDVATRTPHSFFRQRSTATVPDLDDGGGLESVADSRILDRSAGFRQSRGRWSVHRLSRQRPGAIGRRCRCFQWCCLPTRWWSEWNLGGWFHRLAYQRTGILIIILFSVYFCIVLFFAAVYLGVSIMGQATEENPDGSEKIIPFCHMEIDNKMSALYLSLSTMAAIGYGVSNYYFGECWTPLFLVLSQVCCAILFDAVAVGLLFHRISRGRKRSRTIAFSDKAVVQVVRGVPYLMFRMGELKSYHLIGAKIRCYCVRHERIPITNQNKSTTAALKKADNSSNGKNSRRTARTVETTYYVSRQMKLVHPDESFGSDIWMGLPQIIVHRMDGESPLVPSSTWYDSQGMSQTYPRPIHSKIDVRDPLSHGALSRVNDLEEIGEFLIDRDAEIVVLVEGTDELTGASTQARHSYKMTDIAWNHTFLPCIFPFPSEENQRRRGQPVCSIDFSRFHDIGPAPDDCEACAYVPA